MNEKTIHEGRNVKRIREILGIKQDSLALDLGLSQQAVSALEQREKIDDKILADVAKILNIPVLAIKNLTEDAPANFINSFNDNTFNNGPNFQCTVNPLEKYMEQVEANKKLYEDLLQSQKEKIVLLERMIEKK